ncbi:MAG: four helix bundle protein [Candidatus Peribacteraceae bacterium]|nr:four helix bundle protein [Candidatus Peribacteraceae bacterium]
MKKFTDLEVWNVCIALLKETYALTKRLPKEELFGLTAQMRRCTVSILGNIAEGFGRYTFPDKANRYTIARGECNELEAYFYAIVALDFVKEQDIQPALALVSRGEKMLSGLISACRKQAGNM